MERGEIGMIQKGRRCHRGPACLSSGSKYENTKYTNIEIPEETGMIQKGKICRVGPACLFCERMVSKYTKHTI